MTSRLHRVAIVVGVAALAVASACAVRGLGESEAPEPITLGPSASPLKAAAPLPTLPPEPPGAPHFADKIDESSFLRGNLHTHSLRSDGDSPPEQIYAYYRDRGYAFLVLTDHNSRTDPEDFRAEKRAGFVMIPGEEVTTTGAGKPVHVNALCTHHTIGGEAFPTTREALAWAVARVKEQDAIALINHPNFDWTLTADDLPSGRGAELLEVWSGHPYVYSEGDLLRPSHEAIWTKMLDAGEAFAGVAVDDMHQLYATGREPAARPQRGWVQVFGAQATEAAICDGLRRGRLYFSSGAELSRVLVSDDLFAVTVAAASRVEFLGAEGAVLAATRVSAGKEARYKLHGGERYVRARVTRADGGGRAWTQAYRIVR